MFVKINTTNQDYIASLAGFPLYKIFLIKLKEISLDSIDC